MLKINNQTDQLVILADIQQSVPADGSVEISPNQEYRWANSQDVLIAITNGDIKIERNGVEYTDYAEQVNVLKNLKVDSVLKSEGNLVSSENDRLMTATNRIASGYTQYITGRSDDVVNDSYGTGVKLKFDKNNLTKIFEQLDHYYMIGAKGYFDSECTLDDEMKAEMIAPASTGWSDNGSNTGNANKTEVITSSGLYILTPAPLNDGNVDIDLDAFRSGSTKVLANTPVPKPGNTGYWNYDADSNTITAVSNPASPDGGFDLYTFDITLHRFAESVYAGPDKLCDFEAADIIGKKLWNFWQVKLTFEPDDTVGRDPKAVVTFNLGVKGNVN